ncbi:MAG: response regulator [Alphaproteobacteria bacterium]|nr:response regulator [Alphaproteobacteria bacterium]MCB9975663.1 response regulator [Rhodospirillales bacterium]
MSFSFRKILSFGGKVADGRGSVQQALEDALDHYSFGQILFDKGGRFLFANRVARELLPDLDAKKPEGSYLTLSHFIDYLYDHSVDCDESLKNALGQTENGDAQVTFREVVSVASGALRLVEAKASGDGNTLFVVVDFSRDKAREDHLLSLNKNNFRLQKAMQSATNGIVVADAKVVGAPIIFANSSFCGFFNLNYQAVLRCGWGDLSNLVGNDSITEHLLGASITKNDGEIEFSVRSRAFWRWFSLKISVIQDGRGRPDLFVGVFSETTELKNREAEAYQAQKLEALGKLAGGVAHDFNNILSIIDGFSMMAAKKVEKESEAEQYLQRIQAAAKRGAALTGKMLTFSRHKVVSRSVLDLGEFIEGQKILLAPLVNASVRFSVTVVDRNLRVAASENSLAQVLMNLVVNARDAMPDGGSLTIEVSGCPREALPERVRKQLDGSAFVELRVSDTGEGMDQKIIERIFDPFFTTKPQGKGTGLGLSIVYGLVSEMGGALHVDSRKGEGASFALYLPRTKAEVSRKITGDVSDPSTLKLRGVTVLVAEDEPELREIVCEMLVQMEATVLQASNGNEALLVQDDYDGDIDILLSDVVMPEMNGVKLAGLLCSLRPDTKVIFMSGYPNSGDMAPVEVPDDAVFMPKPIDYERLARTLHSVIHSTSSEEGGVAEEEVKPHWVSTSDRVH